MCIQSDDHNNRDLSQTLSFDEFFSGSTMDFSASEESFITPTRRRRRRSSTVASAIDNLPEAGLDFPPRLKQKRFKAIYDHTDAKVGECKALLPLLNLETTQSKISKRPFKLQFRRKLALNYDTVDRSNDILKLKALNNEATSTTTRYIESTIYKLK